ncbi:MAG TPA: hypothetical protein VEZ17_13915, partial [Chitinophagaceae bacterium]|nr:hypothetical protein [Chitinophagaceae bacterium]
SLFITNLPKGCSAGALRRFFGDGRVSGGSGCKPAAKKATRKITQVRIIRVKLSMNLLSAVNNDQQINAA